MSGNPSISVVLVTYRRPEGLDRTLKSIAGQTLAADEVLVCDDCSGDETGKVAARWEARTPNLQYHCQQENLGLCGNLNWGVERAKGDIVINLHDGDVYHPTLFAKCRDALVESPTAGLVFWDSVGKGDKHDHVPGFLAGREFFERFYLYQRKSYIWGTVAARREVYDRLLPFDPEFGAWADVDMWMRVCRHYDVVHIKEPLVDLLVGGTFRPFNFEKVLRVQRMIFLNIYRFYLDEPERLRQALRGQLKVQRKRWLHHMAARAARLQPKLFWNGLRLAPRFFSVPQFSDAKIAGQTHRSEGDLVDDTTERA